MSALFFAAGGLSHAMWLVVLGVFPIAFLYALGRRLSVDIDAEGIRYRGWVGTAEANWKDVIGVTSASYFPYPQNRHYGPYCYKVCTRTRCFVINLLYFPLEFRRTFFEEVKSRGLIRRPRRAF